MNYAAVDIGTNSCRLLIEDVLNPGRSLVREIQTTRIGAGVDKYKQLDQEAMDRTLQGLSKLEQITREYKPVRTRIVATSAVREADNREIFIKRVQEELGWKVEVITGEEEARLSYQGVCNGLNCEHLPLVVDLGGGSTEFMAGEGKELISLPIGAVRATEAQMSKADIYAVLKHLGNLPETWQNYPLVVVGGTATTMVAIKHKLDKYNRDMVHGQTLNRQEIMDIHAMLEHMPLHLRQRLPGLQPERADIINKGALILLLIMDYLGRQEITISESDILDGIIAEMIREEL
ncbi:MAG: Ppx/GppA family phosphatase [Syntrophomonadaceae bacterium]|jgi:exopolyphosphatase/guanosine-5'-triphosphate,3'-diphosphate pyrophosphatase